MLWNSFLKANLAGSANLTGSLVVCIRSLNVSGVVSGGKSLPNATTCLRNVFRAKRVNVNVSNTMVKRVWRGKVILMAKITLCLMVSGICQVTESVNTLTVVT